MRDVTTSLLLMNQLLLFYQIEKHFYELHCKELPSTIVNFHVHFLDFVSLMIHLATSNMGILDELTFEHKAHQIMQQTSICDLHQNSFALILSLQFS